MSALLGMLNYEEPQHSNVAGKFSGTDNPRHLRVLSALQKRSLPRKTLDEVAGASNGPELVAELRRRGLEIPCLRIEALDRDGRPCKPGVYYLTAADRRKLNVWLTQREQARRAA